MTDSPTHPEWPDDFEEDEWYYAPDAGVFQIVAVDMQYDENAERCRGTLDIHYLSGEQDTLDAEQVIDLGLPDDVFRVPPRVIIDPGRVLAEFAAQEITNYTTQLGTGHAYNGIDGVDTIRDLILADTFWSWAQRTGETLPPDASGQNHGDSHQIIATEPV